jgi:hypothetical protein
MSVYAKNELSDLSPQQKKALKALVAEEKRVREEEHRKRREAR